MPANRFRDLLRESGRGKESRNGTLMAIFFFFFSFYFFPFSIFFPSSSSSLSSSFFSFRFLFFFLSFSFLFFVNEHRPRLPRLRRARNETMQLVERLLLLYPRIDCAWLWNWSIGNRPVVVFSVPFKHFVAFSWISFRQRLKSSSSLPPSFRPLLKRSLGPFTFFFFPSPALRFYPPPFVSPSARSINI